MKLLSAEIRNFKLLENVRLDFSTDPARPLTVVRAENGSGKTSVLYALKWALYGPEGLPDEARALRLTSTACPVGVPVEIQIRVEFEHFDEVTGSAAQFRLIRSVTETPREDNKFERGVPRLRLFRVTPRGDEEVGDGAQGMISRLVPTRLSRVFFTNGDDVQQFISGRVASTQRQKSVHEAIRLLLGLEQLETAKGDFTTLMRAFQKEAAKEGGGDLTEIEVKLETARDHLDTVTGQLNEAVTRGQHIEEAIRQDERELSSIQGIGNLDDINARIARLKGDIENLEGQQRGVLGAFRELLSSEEVSWFGLEEVLSNGLTKLEQLADRKVIPGTSVEVLRDRLELERCICGRSLAAGEQAREAVLALLEEQEAIAPRRAKQTETWHLARRSRAGHEASLEAGTSFAALRTNLLKQYTDVRHRLVGKNRDLEAEEERRKLIDEEVVSRLVDRLERSRAKQAENQTLVGRLTADLESASTTVSQLSDEYRKAESRSRVSRDARIRRQAAEDLLDLSSGILEVMKTRYVHDVSDRMNRLFLDIVGSDPQSDVSVFKAVRINDDFDIVIEGGNGRTLDPDFELNGASQRALTLSFIWALMEVAGREAPRIIDTPLGMTSGGVKTRVVEMMSQSGPDHSADFQVILFMTRSEIRDLESVLDARAGNAFTLSCSKDYPKDLINDWGVPRPIVRRCDCKHREVCQVCQRRYDDQHSLSFREV